MNKNESFTGSDSRSKSCNGNGVGMLFDIDGVFLQTKQSSRGIFVDIVREHLDCEFTQGKSDSDLKDFFHSYASQGAVAYPKFFRILEENGVSTSSFKTAEWFAQQHEKTYLDAIDQEDVVMPIPDGIEILRRALNWNRECVAAVTGGTRAQIEIKQNHISELNDLDTIITCNDVADGRGKPHPDGFLAGAIALDLSPEDIIFVEDSESGIRSGKSALLAMGLVRPEPKSKTLDKLQAIPNLLSDTPFTNIVAVQNYNDCRIREVLEAHGI